MQVALATVIVPGPNPIKARTNQMRCIITMGAALLCPLGLDGISGHVDLGPRARVKGGSRPVQTPMRDAEALYLVAGTDGRRCIRVITPVVRHSDVMLAVRLTGANGSDIAGIPLVPHPLVQ